MIVARVRAAYRRWRVRRRRHKLTMAYAKVGQYRHGLGGLSSLLYAYDRIFAEELAAITEDDEIVWRWPPDTEDVQGRYSLVGACDRLVEHVQEAVR